MAPRSGRKRGRAQLALAAALAVATLVALSGCATQENANTDRGMQLFTQKCGTCHTLTAAGTSGTVGPNLDYAFRQARASGMDHDTIEGVVSYQIENPRPASPDQTNVYMPANLVEGDDARDVAAYVGSVAGVPGIKPPVFSPPSFFASTCGGCHTLNAAGTSGTVGPNLDQTLSGQTAAQISQSITDPNAKITPGFPSGVMPQNFGQTLSSKELAQLVAYLLRSVGGGGGGGGGAGGGGGGKGK
jgi:mono/diheme cytochrome c family protein